MCSARELRELLASKKNDQTRKLGLSRSVMSDSKPRQSQSPPGPTPAPAPPATPPYQFIPLPPPPNFYSHIPMTVPNYDYAHLPTHTTIINYALSSFHHPQIAIMPPHLQPQLQQRPASYLPNPPQHVTQHNQFVTQFNQPTEPSPAPVPATGKRGREQTTDQIGSRLWKPMKPTQSAPTAHQQGPTTHDTVVDTTQPPQLSHQSANTLANTSALTPSVAARCGGVAPPTPLNTPPLSVKFGKPSVPPPQLVCGETGCNFALASGKVQEMKRHKLAEHGDFVFMCGLPDEAGAKCCFKITSKDGLLVHMQNVHGNKPGVAGNGDILYLCQQCGYVAKKGCR